MKHPLRTLLAGLGTSLVLVACGGGGGGDSSPSTPSPSLPTARVAANELRVPAGETVTLDGSSSSTPNGGPLAYAWHVETRPDNSKAELSDVSVNQPTFTPDLPGAYRINLVVSDNQAKSQPTSVSITATSIDPVAVVTPTISQLKGQIVQLNGAASLPPEGQDAIGLRYHWTLARLPEGSKALLDSPTSAQPRFTADLDGIYVATLTVSYGERTSLPADVTITIGTVNTPPSVKVGDTIGNAIRGQRVTLDGSATTDADGDALQYRWRFASKPYGSAATIDNASSAIASFVPDSGGSYRLTLTVYDGTTTGGATLNVTVSTPADAPNTKPVARITAPFGKTFEAERSTSIGLTGTYSYDMEDGAIGYNAREWTLLEAPAGFDRDKNWLPNGGQSFIGTEYGAYHVQLRVQDTQGVWSDPVVKVFTVMNGANRPPLARARVAGAGNAVRVGNTITLTASESSDADDNAMTYRWTMVDRPNGSKAELANPNSMEPTFLADQPGPYVFSLLVTDEHGFPSTDGISTLPTELTVLARTRNNAPVARLTVSTNLSGAIGGAGAYTAEQPLVIGQYLEQNQWSQRPYMTWNNFLLEPNGYDPDGDPLTYLWNMTQSPSGATLDMPANSNFCSTNGSSRYPGASIIDFDKWLAESLVLRLWTCPQLPFAPRTAGRYQVELAVSDGIDIAGPYTVNVHAVERENYPSLLLEDMRKQHGIRNNGLVLTDFSNGTPPQQRFFPFDGKKWNYAPTMPTKSLLDTFRDDYVLKTFRLTAIGGDYTITDLQAVDADGVEQPKFVGLTNNQKIHKGESVEFQLAWPVKATPTSGAGGIVTGKDGMTWSFRIAEKPQWTFVYNPIFNYGQNW